MTDPRRHQSGYIFRKGGGWYLRYYEQVSVTGGPSVAKRKCKKLADYDRDHKSKQSVRRLADEFLKPFNDGTYTPTSSMTVRAFVEMSYLPFAKEQKSPSTFDGYRKMWKRYLEVRTDVPLRDFRTVDCERLMNEIAKQYSVSTTTLKHVKNLLSGIFRYAIRTGNLNSANPIRDASVPKGKASKETYAYSLLEIRNMLGVLIGPERAVVAVAAFTGLRRGELRGLRLRDYDGEVLTVRQSIWRKYIGPPKGKRGTGSVPVIPYLKAILDEHIATYSLKEYVFENESGGVADLDYLSAKVIKRALTAAGLPWHGYHAARRGLATNLHQLKVPDITIQAILRHSDVAVTRRSYIKTSGVDPESMAAMRVLESSVSDKGTSDPRIGSSSSFLGTPDPV
jgi:integrase